MGHWRFPGDILIPCCTVISGRPGGVEKMYIGILIGLVPTPLSFDSFAIVLL